MIARRDAFEPAINAFCATDDEGLLAAARASEARWTKGEPCGALDGVPVSIKDNINLAGMTCFRGSAVSSREPAPRGCTRRRPAARGGRALRRQDHHAGVRLEGRRRQPDDRDHPKPLEYLAKSRWQHQRRRRGGRPEPRRHPYRHRRRRLRPHPRRVLRSLRDQAELRPNPRLSGLCHGISGPFGPIDPQCRRCRPRTPGARPTRPPRYDGDDHATARLPENARKRPQRPADRLVPPPWIRETGRIRHRPPHRGRRPPVRGAGGCRRGSRPGFRRSHCDAEHALVRRRRRGPARLQR